MKLILGKKKAKGMTSICEVVRRQEELQKRLGFGMLQTLKVVTDYGLPQNRKQFQKEVDQSQEYYNEHFGPKIEDSVDKHTESELYMLELNKGLKEGKQVAMFQHDGNALLIFFGLSCFVSWVDLKIEIIFLKFEICLIFLISFWIFKIFFD